MQQFAVVQERKNWEASYGSKPTDYVLAVAWHVARADCRCLTVDARAQSRRWLAKRGLRGVRINVYDGKLIIPEQAVSTHPIAAAPPAGDDSK